MTSPVAHKTDLSIYKKILKNQTKTYNDSANNETSPLEPD